MKAKLYFDGSNDPKQVKPASWGYVLEIEGREPIEGQGLCKPEYPATNNTAEYSGLCHGLRRSLLEGVTDIIVQGDSQLVIYQVTGKYKVNRGKNPHLGILWDAAQSLIKKFPNFRIEWIRQEGNKADDVSRVQAGKEGFQRSKKVKGKITRGV
jgi:ribonuclease HI